MVKSTLINVKSNDKLNGLQDGGQDIIEESINLFITAVEETDNLKIVGTSFNNDQKEIFIIDDTNDTSEHTEVVISEIIEKVKNIEVAREFVKVIMGERSPVILNGITRIVGYFSKVNNWNKSKISELNDRRKGEYGVSNS